MFDRLKYFLAMTVMIIIALSMPVIPNDIPPVNYLTFGPAVAQIFDSKKVVYGLIEWRRYFDRRTGGLLLCLETGKDDYYLALGVFKDVNLIERFNGSFSLSSGIMPEHGEEKLGHVLEFRTSLELYYQSPDNHRLGVSLNHYSNSGLGNINPGTESLKLMLSFPVYQ